MLGIATDPTLLAALTLAAKHVMTPAEAHAQRRSFVISAIAGSHPEKTRAELGALVDSVIGPDPLDLGAELARVTAERDEADRRAGAAERRMAWLEECARKHQRWMSERKAERGFGDDVSLEAVWAVLCATADTGQTWLPIAQAERDGTPYETCRMGAPDPSFGGESFGGYAEPPETAWWCVLGERWQAAQRPHDVWEPTHFRPLSAAPARACPVCGGSPEKLNPFGGWCEGVLTEAGDHTGTCAKHGKPARPFIDDAQLTGA